MRDMIDYYERRYREDVRLQSEIGPLEFARTQEILQRYLAKPPAVVLDIGGGPGAYTRWLSSLGYAVHLLDPVPRHLSQARDAARSVLSGDARTLPFADDAADAALLLGPLYHLTSREDRVTALAEARRVVRPGGVVIGAGISRFASLLDGVMTAAIDDPAFQAIVTRDLQHGQHRAAPDRPDYFTTAYFHGPDQLRAEAEEAGFANATLIAVEGPVWIAPDFQARWADPGHREVLLQFARAVECEPAIMGVSLHLLVVGYVI